MKQIGDYLLSKKGQINLIPDPKEIGETIRTFLKTENKVSVSIQKGVIVVNSTAALKNELFVRQEEIKKVILSRYSGIKNLQIK